MKARSLRFISLVLCTVLLFSVSQLVQADADNVTDGEIEYIAVQVSKQEALSSPLLHDMSSATNKNLFGNISAPAIFSDYTESDYGTVEGDIYVSPDGSDKDGDGSMERPYATFEKAQTEARRITREKNIKDGEFTIVFMPGEYRLTSGIIMNAADSGLENCMIVYAAHKRGTVVFKGSVDLPTSGFTPVSGEAWDILPAESRDKVLMIDLKKYGISSDMLGMYVIGQESNAASYDQSLVGTNMMLSVDREAFTLARYPNEGTLLVTEGIVDQGNPSSGSPGIAKLTDEAIERAKGWHSTEDVWIVGRFFQDWATKSSPVSIDLEQGTASFIANSFDSARSDTPYHFYNVLDELDAPGEWYVDRQSCILYMYPRTSIEDSDIELCIGFDDVMIYGKYVRNVTFKGIDFMGGLSDGILLYDVNNIHLDRCRFYNFGGKYTVEIGGENCSIIECEAHYVAATGLSLYGGTKSNLSLSNDIMENCYVTNWGLTTHTFSDALSINGYGTVMRHCEAAYGYGNALSLGFAESIAEYNIFHDCTVWSTDCGALYTGSSLMGCPNNQLRYNIFYNIGSEWASPSAIFWDDGHGSQRAYGNLFVNIGGNGITVGGGRNHSIVNNIIINVGRDPIYYDQRPYDGFNIYGKYIKGDFYDTDGGYMWENFKNVPKTKKWYQAIAYLQHVLTKDSYYTSPHFMYNPSMSHIADNIIIDDSCSLGRLANQTRQYSIVKDNYVAGFDMLTAIFLDPYNGDYRIREDAPIYEIVPDFKDIPYHLIGRY